MYIYRISHLFSIHQWKVGGLKFRPVSEIFSYFYILYLLIYIYFKILSSSMRYFEILFPLSIQIFYFIRAKIWRKSYLQPFFGWSKWSFHITACLSFLSHEIVHMHVLHMKIIHGSISCSCINLNQICRDWKFWLVSLLIFFFFSLVKSRWD